MARQNFVGLVISQGKMAKTVKVRVQQKSYNKKIHKELIKRKDYLVHDEGEICREGDLVRIEATRPLSPRKFFAVAEIKKNKGQQFAKYEEEAKNQVLQEENIKASFFLKRRKETSQQDIIKDLYQIQKLSLSSPERITFSENEINKVNELKLKYGITSWPPKEKLFDLNVEKLSQEIENLKLELNKIQKEVELDKKLMEIIENENKVEIILQKMGKQNTSDLKNSIKKNLCKKYLKSAQHSELIELGLTSN
ncbi:hypothetical protein PACTADRAFT_51514 [Pachysolen tannophilus NRRL Y-2460]|uniref:Uncharacterized protein n=1 Tax=Pachysolen tannophilus NRRL Y-2460 TaxID=669874 RepID=A0A1E4TQ09_PACTA|nr:hypothetical protein PACTADRAFT_51514 [Pachysolen tannophilus NRRL Y-2460]